MAISRRRPTSADVAARAGVSRTTVSFVLNDRPGTNISRTTRDRVREAAAELGYHPHASARGLAGGKSHILGFVLLQSPEQVAGDATLAETLSGLASAARTAGFRVMVEPLDPTEANYEALLRAQHADGIVVSGPRSGDRGLARLADDGFPIVLQGTLRGIRAPSVDVAPLTLSTSSISSGLDGGGSAASRTRRWPTPRRKTDSPGTATPWKPLESRTTRCSSRRPRSTPAAVTGRWSDCSPGVRSRQCSWPATSSRSARSLRFARRDCRSPPTFRLSASTISPSPLISIPLSPPSVCRPMIWDWPPARRYSIGWQADRFQTGHCSRPSSSFGPQRLQREKRRRMDRDREGDSDTGMEE